MKGHENLQPFAVGSPRTKDSCKRADEAAMVQRYENGIEWEKRNDE